MVYKLGVWIVVCLAMGELLNLILTPGEFVCAAVLFAAPLVVFGFHYNYTSRVSCFYFTDLEMYSSRVAQRQLTFWGWPIGRPEMIRSDSRLAPGVSRLLPAWLEALTPRTRLPIA
ncbi:MAG: hypothetical protein HY815_08055 [Candidatus Riflebacteria bacterium]|nr:hypothetical protein [Candidatus Riflebacteria bacterium]